jgi:hypothetical protein
VQYTINGEAAFVMRFYLANNPDAWEDYQRQRTSYVSGAEEEKASENLLRYVPGGEVSQSETGISNSCESVGDQKPVHDEVGWPIETGCDSGYVNRRNGLGIV